MRPDHLSKMLERLARQHDVPGAQLAILHEGDISAVQVGEKEYGSGGALSESSPVPLGSITKTFTATVAMILVSDGDLELDEPVATYLPELRRQASADLAATLTLRHLLSHTGGLVCDPSTTARRPL